MRPTPLLSLDWINGDSEIRLQLKLDSIEECIGAIEDTSSRHDTFF
jgi:hypothetical protein